jgi:hypothetical protein
MHKNGGTTPLPDRKPVNNSSAPALTIPDEYLEGALRLLARATARRQLAETVIRRFAA